MPSTSTQPAFPARRSARATGCGQAPFGGHRQGQSDGEQPDVEAQAMTEVLEADPGGVGEQHPDQRDLHPAVRGRGLLRGGVDVGAQQAMGEPVHGEVVVAELTSRSGPVTVMDEAITPRG